MRLAREKSGNTYHSLIDKVASNITSIVGVKFKQGSTPARRIGATIGDVRWDFVSWEHPELKWVFEGEDPDTTTGSVKSGPELAGCALDSAATTVGESAVGTDIGSSEVGGWESTCVAGMQGDVGTGNIIIGLHYINLAVGVCLVVDCPASYKG